MRPYIYECDLDFDCPIKRHDYNFNLSAKEAEYYQMEKEDFLQSKEKIAFLEVVQKFQHIYTIFILTAAVNQISPGLPIQIIFMSR